MINENDSLLNNGKVFELIFDIVEEEKDIQKAVEKISALVDGLHSSSLISPRTVFAAKAFVKNELPIYLSAKDLFLKKGFDLKIVSHQKSKTYTPEEIESMVDKRIERAKSDIIEEAASRASSTVSYSISDDSRNR